MPKRTFAIEPNGPKSLKLQWKGAWKSIEVSFEDHILGTIEDQDALQEGAEFLLPSGSVLFIQLRDSIPPRLMILIDGMHATDSDTSPHKILQTAIYVTYFIGVLNILLGGLGFFKIPIITQMGFGTISLFMGIVIVELGNHSRKYHSKVSLIAVMIIFAVDTMASVILVKIQGESPFSLSIIIKILLISLIYRGVDAIDQIKSKKTDHSSPQ